MDVGVGDTDVVAVAAAGRTCASCNSVVDYFHSLLVIVAIAGCYDCYCCCYNPRCSIDCQAAEAVGVGTEVQRTDFAPSPVYLKAAAIVVRASFGSDPQAPPFVPFSVTSALTVPPHRPNTPDNPAAVPRHDPNWHRCP